MKIGYARVSTEDQNLDLQLQALEAAGCEIVFQDHGVSAVAHKRPGLDETLAHLKPGDTLVIWKLDRACRSLRHALDLLEDLQSRNIDFLSLTDSIDTTTAMGKAMYQLRGVFSELERSLISERTKAGMAAARKRGKHLGRPPTLTNHQLAQAAAWTDQGNQTIASAAATLGVKQDTLRKALQRYKAEQSNATS